MHIFIKFSDGRGLSSQKSVAPQEGPLPLGRLGNRCYLGTSWDRFDPSPGPFGALSRHCRSHLCCHLSRTNSCRRSLLSRCHGSDDRRGHFRVIYSRNKIDLHVTSVTKVA
ncbi:hypothetical protein NPIL_216151 [Nephila pilipes]|uniref:Uncharacterized protein n=1 Tax=Nephila pilipes TaxID=299642 RepID=A0A8X6NES1_NEPPI|nr:hypothetical protein NPIL_216151 [Nephila pilipes]